jgi:hypothetical protein
VRSQKFILDQADAAILDRFLIGHNSDGCLTCPVTGSRIPISKWNITNRLCLVPLMGDELTTSKNFAPMLRLTSPAGGVILLDAVAVGLVSVAKVN